MVTCPECEADIALDASDVDEGDTISCESCGTEFEVTSVAPLELEALDDEDEEDEGFGEEDDEDLDEDDEDLDDDDEETWGDDQ